MNVNGKLPGISDTIPVITTRQRTVGNTKDDIVLRIAKAATLTLVMGGATANAAWIGKSLATYGLPRETRDKLWVGVACIVAISYSYEAINKAYNVNNSCLKAEALSSGKSGDIPAVYIAG